jgi:hypothetical protein
MGAGLTFPTLAVTVCTIRFNIQKFYILLTECIYVLYVAQKTVTFAIYSINWSVFITEMVSVYCMMRTWHLYKTDCISSLKVRGIIL